VKTGVSLCVHLLGGSGLMVVTVRNRATLSDFDLLLRASNSLQYLEGHEVFSVVTGGRPLSFSRLISRGSRSSPDLWGENAEGSKTPLLISRRKDQAGSLGTEKTS
jgi:hypothetical protein